MIDLLTKLKTLFLFLKNKGLLIPLVPFIFFLLFFIVFISFSVFSPQSATPNGQNVPIPTKVDQNIPPSISQSPTITQDDLTTFPVDETIHGDEPITLYEDALNLEKKESLPDGSIKYSFTTSIKGRPDVVISQGEGQNTIFERSVTEQGVKVLLSDYLDFFGQPEKIITGSQFYGSSAQTYIYSKKGVAYIANPQTNQILELHIFAPTSMNDYINRFGDDLIVTPTP